MQALGRRFCQEVQATPRSQVPGLLLNAAFAALPTDGQPPQSDPAMARPVQTPRALDSGSPAPALWYVKVKRCPRHAVTEDIVDFFQRNGLPVTADDVKPHYRADYSVIVHWLVRLRSQALVQRARQLGRDSDDNMGLFRPSVHLTEPGEEALDTEPLLAHSQGRCVLISNLPPNTASSSVYRLFKDFLLAEGRNLTILPGKMQQSNTRAIVRFATPEEAERAFRMKHTRMYSPRDAAGNVGDADQRRLYLKVLP